MSCVKYMKRGINAFLSVTLLGLLSNCGNPSFEGIVPKSDRNSGYSLDSNGQSASPYNEIHAIGGWDVKPVVIKFQKNVPSEIREQIERAAATWNTAIGERILVFDGEVPDFNGPLAQRYDDNVTTFGYESHWCRTSKTKQVLGTTIWRNSETDPHKLTAGDIVFNAEDYLFGDSSVENNSDDRELVDAESVALHEFGHLLGLSHIPEEVSSASIMNPYIMIGKGRIDRLLAPIDIEMVRFVYTSGAPRPEKLSQRDPATELEPPVNPNPPQEEKPCD